ncbi:PRC-barrel domain-containing protein [Devosia riboflavina]|uniref:PRC-barrel domain-containing protein n=1 Tax=Devosia riboflavina TaxID=46914 RepID=UPI00068E2235|nr:PRC-barrel domain-containing protein [Devosia riboflavina]
MIRTLLTTTAVAVLMGTAAIAQEAPAPTDAPATTTEAPATDAPATTPADATTPPSVDAAPVDTGAAEETDVNEPWDMSAGYVAADTDNLGTRLIGQPVYSSAGDDAEEIGSINDLVFSEGGQIEAVVIGVGGFLGIGEKNVAVDFDSLEFTLAADNTERWVLPTTAEALTTAPDFVWEEDVPADGAAPADAMAPAAPDAMAPAVDPAAPVTTQ